MAFSYGGMFGLLDEDDNRTDYALSYGATWKVSFTYSDTGETVPASFKGMTGFGDLDGTTNNDAAGLAQNVREGVELLDGFDAAYTVRDAHLVRYGTNGWGGAKDNNKAQTDLSSGHAQQHTLDAVFSGPSITFRYTSLYKTYGTVFGAPLTQAQLVYAVTGKAVDQTGATLKTWEVAKGLRTGDTYQATHPDIDDSRRGHAAGTPSRAPWKPERGGRPDPNEVGSGLPPLSLAHRTVGHRTPANPDETRVTRQGEDQEKSAGDMRPVSADGDSRSLGRKS